MGTDTAGRKPQGVGAAQELTLAVTPEQLRSMLEAVRLNPSPMRVEEIVRQAVHEAQRRGATAVGS